MEYEALPQYMRIAAAIADRIARGVLAEGQRLSGRSTLSSEYSVSPETIRKGLRLLADMGIVQVREGSGTVVLSAEKAAGYLETIQVRQKLVDLRGQLQELLRENAAMSQQMIEISNSLIAASANPLPSERALPNYEVTVPEDSDKVGLSIGELRFWQCTGATVVAIRRGQSVQVSPGPYTELKAGDVLVYVGAPECKEAVEQLLSGSPSRTALYRMTEQITAAVHMSELSVIAEALGARLGEITDFTALTKGMTNRSYLFSCKGKRYILRIPGEGTDNLIDRAQEAAVYRAIAGRGLCDDVVYLNPRNGLKVTEFLEGVRSCDPFSRRDLEKAMALLRRFHRMDIQVDHEFGICRQIEYYESLWKGAPSAYPDYLETKEHVMELRNFVLAHREKLCLTHVDAVPDNFLFYTRDGREELQLTDWEYAAMQDPHVDIAMFIIYSGYDRTHADELIDLYFEGGCRRETRIKIYCYVAACGLLWSNWCEYKRQLGVEFGEYALAQYRYAKEYYKIAKKEMEQL